MSEITVLFNVPVWALPVLGAIKRGDDNKLSAVSVPLDDLKTLFQEWDAARRNAHTLQAELQQVTETKDHLVNCYRESRDCLETIKIKLRELAR